MAPTKWSRIFNKNLNNIIITREEKLETIAKLWSKTMFYTNWEWENPNERVLEMLMREVGYWPYKDEDDMIAKSQVNEELYQRAKKIISTRKPIRSNNDTIPEEVGNAKI